MRFSTAMTATTCYWDWMHWEPVFCLVFRTRGLSIVIGTKSLGTMVLKLGRKGCSFKFNWFTRASRRHVLQQKIPKKLIFISEQWITRVPAAQLTVNNTCTWLYLDQFLLNKYTSFIFKIDLQFTIYVGRSPQQKA